MSFPHGTGSGRGEPGSGAAAHTLQDILRPRAKGSPCLELHLRESISSPLVPDDVGYLAFFTRTVERLEGGAEKVGKLVEEESHDLLTQASTCIFSHLLHSDPDFNFKAVIAPHPG